MLKGISIMGLLLVAGCANIAMQQRIQQIDAAWAQAASACDRHYTDPRLAPLKGLLPDSREEPTFAMLANPRKATAAEQPAIQARAEAFLKCATENRAVFATFGTAQHVAVFDAYVNGRSNRYVQLHNGELSFGEFLRTWNASWNETQKTLADIDAALAAQNRQAALQAQQNYLLLQQNINRTFNQARPITCFQNNLYTTCQ